MRHILTLAGATLLALVLAVPAHAGEGRGKRAGKHRARKGRIFQHLDKNRDGALTADEVPTRLWQRLVKADANGDASVTKEELKAARKHRADQAESGQTVGEGGKGRAGKDGRRGARKRHGRKHRRRARLRQLDKNGDKALSQDEVPAKLWERLVKADANGDGSVTKDEVKAYRKSKREAGADAR